MSLPIPAIVDLTEDEINSCSDDGSVVSSSSRVRNKLTASLMTPTRRRSVRLTEKLKHTPLKIEETSVASPKVKRCEKKSVNMLVVTRSGNSDETTKPNVTAIEHELIDISEEIDAAIRGSNKNGIHDSATTLKENKEQDTSTKLKKKSLADVENQKPKILAENSKHLSAMRLGSNKSGRFWKTERDRFRSTVKVKGLKQLSTQKRIAKKEQYLRVREYEKSLKEDVKRIRKEKEQRTEENKKRKAENEKKNEIVQVIKNPAKIKRMKKKQLRMLAKRDAITIAQGKGIFGQ